jgi:thioredoxin-related protein
MRLTFLLLLLPVSLFAQDSAGIFENKLSWKEIEVKALRENKYIFVDCMTTWCLPCKAMEVIYRDQKVAKYLQENFVSVKVQMDTSKKDDEYVKSRYADAAAIAAKYKVTTFPSYLFFSPDGQIVHRDLGSKKADAFMNVLKNAKDTSMQFYTLLSKYKSGRLDPSRLPYLTNLASTIHDKALAKELGRDCINKYLLKLGADKLFTPDNIYLIRTYVTSRDKEAFQLFFKKASIIDSVMEKEDLFGYSNKVICRVISNEEIYPHLWKDDDPGQLVTNKPNWNTMYKTIQKKYGLQFAEKTILDAKISWYYNNEQWPALLQTQVAKIEKYGLDTLGSSGKEGLNSVVWYLFFFHTSDSTLLLKAAHWMEAVVKRDDLKSEPRYPGWVDTYANVLYKAGRVNEALAWEKMAMTLAPKDKDIQEAYDKMQKSLPTWN